MFTFYYLFLIDTHVHRKKLFCLQAKYSWLSGLKINFHRFVSTNNNISLILYSAHLNRSSHSVNNINMNIENSVFVNYQLTFQGSRYNIINRENSHADKSPQINIKLTMKNSTFTGTDPEHVISIQIKSASGYFDGILVFGGNQTISIFDVVDNSYLMIKNSKFTGNSVVETKAAVMTIRQSKVMVANCILRNNQGQEGGVMHAFIETTLTISHSLFENNSATDLGGAIFTVKLVNVSVANSSFLNNSAVNFGGAIYSTSRTRFNIAHTKFVNNNAPVSSGGAIATMDQNYYFINDCEFKENSAGRDGAVLFTNQNNFLYINNSDFIGNIGEFKSGVMRVQQHGETLINNCRFVNNTARFSQSVISAQNNMTINITNSLFYNNTSEYVGFLEVSRSSIGHLSNCTFAGNSANVTSLFYVAENASVKIRSSRFYDNTGCLLLGEHKSDVRFFSTQFLNRSLATTPMMVIIECNLILVDSKFDNNSQTNDGGIVLARDSKISVTSCNFSRNHASKGTGFYLAANSELMIDKCLFINNTAADATVAYMRNSTAIFSKTDVINSKGIGYGGIMAVFNSKVQIFKCIFSSAKAVYGGCIYLQIGSSLAAYDSVFENSYAREGGAILKYGAGNVSLTNCTLRNNIGRFGAAIYHFNANYLRLAGGICKQPTKSCITFELDKNKAFKYRCTLYTYNFTIESDRGTINSASDENFFEDTAVKKMIIPADKYTRWWEIPYASREFTFLSFDSKLK